MAISPRLTTRKLDDFFSPSPNSQALVIGAAGVDIVGRLHDKLRLGSSNPSQIRSAFGGVARNVAENLARLGQPVQLITAVGKDSVGDQLLSQVSQAGVYATSQTSGNLPAIRTEIVDPTGGGDALTAAVLFGLLNDIPLDDAVRLGVSAATLTLRYPGAVVPDLTLEKLYDQLVI